MTLYRNQDGAVRKCSYIRVAGHLLLNPFLVAIAIWAVLFSIRILIDFDSLIQLLPELAPVILYSWALLYFLGGSAMLVGAAIIHSKISAAGCMLFSIAAFMDAIFVALSGIPGYKWQVFTMCLFAAAALFRVRHLIKGEMLFWVRT